MENHGRTVVQFAFYQFDAAWRRQSAEEERERDRAEFAEAVEQAADEMMVRSLLAGRDSRRHRPAFSGMHAPGS